MENQTKTKIEFSGRWRKRQEGLDLQNDQHRAAFLRANLERTRAKLHARQNSTLAAAGEEANTDAQESTCCSSNRSEHKEQPSRASETEEIDKESEGSSPEEDEGTPITDATWKVIGSAPKAARPDWLPKSGKGQANVDPLNWSLTIEQWIMFIIRKR